MPEPAFKPFATLGYEQAADGTFNATLTVSGLANEQQAQAAVAYMQHLFCAEEMEARDA